MRLGVWESVWLTNLLALPLLAALACVGATSRAGEKLLSMSLGDGIVLFVSSVVATLIGYAGWLCRGVVSATSYTLIGVGAMLGTVLLAIAFLDKHVAPGRPGPGLLHRGVVAVQAEPTSRRRREGAGRGRRGGGDARSGVKLSKHYYRGLLSFVRVTPSVGRGNARGHQPAMQPSVALLPLLCTSMGAQVEFTALIIYAITRRWAV